MPAVRSYKAQKVARPDLITLDLSMSNKAGVRFYGEIRADPEFARVPAVLVTAVAGPGGNQPPEGVVAKPIDPEEMIGIVRRLTT